MTTLATPPPAPVCNDFQIVLLWIRALELVVGHPIGVVIEDLCADNGPFVQYRPPYKA